MATRKRSRPPLVHRLAWGAGLALLLLTLITNGLLRGVSAPGPSWFDPRHLPAKLLALGLYARHRASCAWGGGDADVTSSARLAARRAGIEPALFLALVEIESGARAHRISPTGAMGPAQLTAATARLMGVDDPFEPRTATLGGARYLQRQLSRFQGDRALALAAYNAGPGAVHGAVPHNGETERYVPRVLAAYARMRGEQAALERMTTPARRPSL